LRNTAHICHILSHHHHPAAPTKPGERQLPIKQNVENFAFPPTRCPILLFEHCRVLFPFLPTSSNGKKLSLDGIMKTHKMNEEKELAKCTSYGNFPLFYSAVPQ
jgi:hypothetical protein